MHTTIKLIAASVLSLSIPAQALPVGAPEDVDALIEFIEKTHPDPHRVCSAEEWRREAENLRSRISDLEPHRAAFELQRLLAAES